MFAKINALKVVKERHVEKKGSNKHKFERIVINWNLPLKILRKIL